MKGSYKRGDADAMFSLGEVIDAMDYAKAFCRDQDLDFTPDVLLGFMLGLRYCAPETPVPVSIKPEVRNG